ncbi:MAG TPA: hypothetical protein PKX04_06185 [Chitinophagales bacterium]|nr:hypothetical protein [Chitinophagales bacterium]
MDEQLNQILWTTAKYPAFQRNNIYAHKYVPQKERMGLKNEISKFLLQSVLPIFKNNSVSEIETIKLIERLSNLLSRNYKSALKDEKFTVGTSQKIVSVYIKSMWLTGNTEEPNICPIDGIILKHIGFDGDSWTAFDIRDYKSALTACKDVMKTSDYSTIAVWELMTYKELSKNK